MIIIQAVFAISILVWFALQVSARDPTRPKKRTKTALQDLAEVASIMAESRREWSQMNRNAMKSWEQRFDPERTEREERERQRPVYSPHALPPPQYMPSPFEDFFRGNPDFPYEQLTKQYIRHGKYENRQRRV